VLTAGRRKAAGAAGVVVIIVAAVVTLVIWPRNSPSHNHSTTSARRVGTSITATTTTVTSMPTSTSPATSIASQAGSGSITEDTQDFVDNTRPLVRAGVELAPYRALPTTIWRPQRDGHFPLVVFVHGYNMTPAAYGQFCSSVAEAGYVVAAPSFPLEDPTRGNGLDRDDLPNEAKDVAFVITEMTQGSEAIHVVPSKVAVVGHSDGADVALEVGYESGLSDSRVSVTVADAPDAITSPVVTTATAPLLLIQGNADTVVPYSNSQRVFTQIPTRRYYETLLGADHLPPIVGNSQWSPVLYSDVIDFLDAELGDSISLNALPQLLSNSRLESLQIAG